MTTLATLLVVLALVATLGLIAWWWVGFLVSVYQSLPERLAAASRDSSRPSSHPGEGGHDHPEHYRPHGYWSSSAPPLSSPPPARSTRDLESRGPFLASTPVGERLEAEGASRSVVEAAERRTHPSAALPLLGVASQPDFDAFFGGLEAAVLAGGIAVIGLVVVLAVRRLTSF